MISEQITVTTTAISIRQHLAAKREVDLEAIPKKCTGIMLRVDIDSTKVVSLVDDGPGGGSVDGAIVLDAQKSVVSTSFANFGIDKTLLKCDADTIVVHVIINQTL